MNFEMLYKGKIGALKEAGVHILLIGPQTFGRVIGFPLSPADSMTFLKSQSPTIPFCKIDLTDPFASGQLYVHF